MAILVFVFTLALVDFHRHMHQFTMLFQRRFVVFGGFGVMGNQGNDGGHHGGQRPNVKTNLHVNKMPVLLEHAVADNARAGRGEKAQNPAIQRGGQRMEINARRLARIFHS